MNNTQIDAECLAVLRKPWYSSQSQLYQNIVWVLFAVSFLGPSSLVSGKLWKGVFLLVVLTLNFLSQRRRERSWRRLIESQAPELAQKLKKNA